MLRPREAMNLEELKLEIKRLIVQELDIRDRGVSDIDDDEPLFGVGLGLDSLDALQLAMALEERFGIRIPEGEQAKAIFASVSTIAEHVAGSG
jgi:acyl carrier protein